MKNPTKVIMQGLSVIGAVLVITLAAGTVLNAEDWAQWRGSDRLGIWTETGIIDSFPAEGQVACTGAFGVFWSGSSGWTCFYSRLDGRPSIANVGRHGAGGCAR